MKLPRAALTWTGRDTYLAHRDSNTAGWIVLRTSCVQNVLDADIDCMAKRIDQLETLWMSSVQWLNFTPVGRASTAHVTQLRISRTRLQRTLASHLVVKFLEMLERVRNVPRRQDS